MNWPMEGEDRKSELWGKEWEITMKKEDDES